MADLQSIRAAASVMPGLGLISEEELAKMIIELYRRGIPSLPPMTATNRGVRLFPRSADVNGHYLTATATYVTLAGPFGDVITLYVDNTDTAYDAIIQGPGATTLTACRVRATKLRRLEFDTPTDSQGNPVNSLPLWLWATGSQTKPTYVEVE